ncbi:MAG TPA: M23 family metallopeptidase, partial [Verrucomicrobiae bacterium]|nr:M23 family metallopeptidase [Verrucomicrobiae bacterium]
MFKFGRTGLVYLPVMVLLALVTSRANAFPVDLGQETQQVFRYTVQPGDSFWNIGQRFAVDAADLAVQNAMNTSDALQVGDQLAIPKHDQTRVHRVKAGENLWSIANQYGVPVSSLAKTNNVREPNLLKIGQVLTLPAAQARATRGGVSPVPEKSAASFQWPLSGTISSPYGWRKGEFHDGLDIAAEKGTEIAAARGGTVVFAGW